MCIAAYACKRVRPASICTCIRYISIIHIEKVQYCPVLSVWHMHNVTVKMAKLLDSAQVSKPLEHASEADAVLKVRNLALREPARASLISPTVSIAKVFRGFPRHSLDDQMMHSSCCRAQD